MSVFDCVFLLIIPLFNSLILFLPLRVKPAIFDLLLAVCIAAYLGMMYLAIQVSHWVHAVVCSPFQTCTALINKCVVSFICLKRLLPMFTILQIEMK